MSKLTLTDDVGNTQDVALPESVTLTIAATTVQEVYDVYAAAPQAPMKAKNLKYANGVMDLQAGGSATSYFQRVPRNP